MRTGVYPGTFNPPTVGHVAVVEAALEQFGLDRLDLVVSRAPLAKGVMRRPALEDRLRVVRASVERLPQVSVAVTDLQLIADIAQPYDVVVMGLDKWEQVNDIAFYDDAQHRDHCLRRLPTLAIAPRHNAEPGAAPVPAAAVLRLDAGVAGVSSTAARRGAVALMTPAAREFDRHTGAWSDAHRYDAWVTAGRPEAPGVGEPGARRQDRPE